MSCEHSRGAQLWHDDELAGAERDVFEAHLAGCEECWREVGALAAIGNVVAGVERPAISGIALGRLHRSMEKLREGDVLRIAVRLTLAAAVTLIIGLAALLWRSPAQSRPVAAWEWTMLDPHYGENGGTTELASNDAPDIAQWLEAGPSKDRQP